MEKEVNIALSVKIHPIVLEAIEREQQGKLDLYQLSQDYLYNGSYPRLRAMISSYKLNKSWIENERQHED